MSVKKPSQSLTIWSGAASAIGGLTVLITVIMRQWGIEASDDEIGAIMGGMVSAVTGILAIYGRWRATTIIQRGKRRDR